VHRRALALALAAALAQPSLAAAKDPGAPVRVQWNSPPPAGTTWDARFSLLQGPGGFAPDEAVRPVVVVRDVRTGATRRVAARVDVPPNTFRADVRLPGPGTWRISVARFDPSRPARTAAYGAPVRVGATPPDGGRGAPGWLWPVLGASAVAAAAVSRGVRRRNGPATATAADADIAL
jgi:hypothetical protein